MELSVISSKSKTALGRASSAAESNVAFVARDCHCAIVGPSAKVLVVQRPVEDAAESGQLSFRASDPLRALTQQALSGDETATRTLLMELGGTMLRTVRKVLGAHHPEVEDVTQEAMLGLLKSLAHFRGECSVAHYANQIALRRALHARRHFVVRDRVGELSVDSNKVEAVCAETPFGEAIAQQRRQVVRRLLDRLSEPMAEALALHFMLGYTVEEIASALDISPNTVWSRLKLGKRALRDALASDRQLKELLGERTP